jgi:Protein of unknown function (DUF2905)
MQSGKFIMAVGALIFLGGLIWYFFGDKLHWIGRLPGDIRIERDNFRFYFPITTMVVVSLLVSLIMIIVRKVL